MTVNTSLPAGDLIDKKNYFPWNGYAHHNKRQPMNEIIRSEGFFYSGIQFPNDPCAWASRQLNFGLFLLPALKNQPNKRAL